MAAGPLLVSEPLQRFRALGLAGDPVWRSAGQLRAAIAARLSREHADLLALPEAEPSGRTINWYAPFDGEVKRLSDLDDAERREMLDRVQRLHGEIAGLATQMEAAERSGAERNFGRLLRHALTAPGEETLYVVDGRPVMTFWGFTAEAALPGVFFASPPPAVAGAASMRAAAPGLARPAAVLASAPAVAAVAGPRTVWWQWLLLGVVLMLILALLAWLVRPYLPRIEPYIEAEARERALGFAVRQPAELQQVRAATLVQDNEDLRLELARLTDELSRRGGDCAAGVIGPGGVIVGSAGGPPIERGAGPDLGVAAADPAQDAKDPNKPPAKGADVKGADVKGPDEQNKDKSAAAPNDPKNDAGNGKKDEPKPMVVPPEAKQKQDLAFLKGDWRSRTGLATATGEKDLRPNYTLDDKGKGKVSFTQKNGTTCEAPAEARWDGTKLVIEEKSNPRCSDGKTYARNTVNCEIGADGAAQCKGSQPGDPRSYKVQIGR